MATSSMGDAVEQLKRLVGLSQSHWAVKIQHRRIHCRIDIEWGNHGSHIFPLFMDQEGCIAQHCGKERVIFIACTRLQATVGQKI